MNKTVLLACCDFLILATLALTSFNKTPDMSNEGELVPENSFQIEDKEESSEELVEAFYELQINKLNERLSVIQNELQAKDRELVNQKLLAQNKDSELQKLKLELNKRSTSVFKSVLNNLWQVNVAMTEDDSFNPDTFRNSFFSCAFSMNKDTYLLADFNKLGFSWDEIIADGNINKLGVTLAKTGPNPWSSVCKGPVYSMNQDPALCLLKLPKNRVYDPLQILPYSKLPNYLEKVYAAKADGRVIKVKNLSIIPNDPNWIVIDEERFLGHPDKVEKGDILVSNDGFVIGLVSRENQSGNKRRLSAFILSRLDFNESTEIPLTKKSQDLYFNDFVNRVKQIYRKLK